MTEFIEIKRTSVHNLKEVSINIPRERLVVITGVSGSGKSSLAFDTLFAEGQRRYVESLSSYARQFLRHPHYLACVTELVVIPDIQHDAVVLGDNCFAVNNTGVAITDKVR